MSIKELLQEITSGDLTKTFRMRVIRPVYSREVTEQGVVDVSLAMVKIMAGKAYEDYHGKQIPTGEYVCLEVTDNGCGMDEETKW